MRKIIYTVTILLISISCNKTVKNEASDSIKSKYENSKKEETGKTLPSADYSSLLVNYECDMTAAEIAKVFDIPETDVSVPEYQRAGRCAFVIKGFGQNTLGDETVIQWFLENVGKAQVKKEIQNYLKDQANNKSVLGMGIEMSETGDSYVAKIPMSGRAVIMNENYDSWLLLSYSQKGMYKSRTEAQHAALGEKTMALANYLLKKHKK
ncbi:MAG: hypothetical protein GW839_09925 [Flavobacteriales bacterium]|nr:hypothetical protein [Flavobacteriia bacterium]NCP06905.1 hypothetical protein [Flavobacteriales bacterium]NCP52759.1 hypothetical protein [Flavobacteriales bacterium]NCP60600.1 hypothetical protein [Flavobacteriales bacterium]NCP90431.1 hypothetical protein [Flavobacteriales bacterium]